MDDDAPVVEGFGEIRVEPDSLVVVLKLPNARGKSAESTANSMTAKTALMKIAPLNDGFRPVHVVLKE